MNTAITIAKAIVEKVTDLMSVELPSENDDRERYAFELEIDDNEIDVELYAHYTSERFISVEFMGAVDYGQRVELKRISNLSIGYDRDEIDIDEAAVLKEINSSLYFGVWAN